MDTVKFRGYVSEVDVTKARSLGSRDSTSIQNAMGKISPLQSSEHVMQLVILGKKYGLVLNVNIKLRHHDHCLRLNPMTWNARHDTISDIEDKAFRLQRVVRS